MEGVVFAKGRNQIFITLPWVRDSRPRYQIFLWKVYIHRNISWMGAFSSIWMKVAKRSLQTFHQLDPVTFWMVVKPKLEIFINLTTQHKKSKTTPNKDSGFLGLTAWVEVGEVSKPFFRLVRNWSAVSRTHQPAIYSEHTSFSEHFSLKRDILL